MSIKPFSLALATALLASTGAGAVESGLTLQLGHSGGDFERRTVNYECGPETSLSVTYINAAPNFLAIVPVEEETEPLVFSSILSGSGVRYAAGHWLWMTQGPEASLHDVTLDEDAEPVLSCSEINNTP